MPSSPGGWAESASVSHSAPCVEAGQRPMGSGEFRGFAGRSDMARRKSESWRPPLLKNGGRWGGIRRFFDLQAGSIWHDLSVVLPSVHGTVVDAGCGAQPYRRLLAADARYIGIDITDAKTHF